MSLLIRNTLAAAIGVLALSGLFKPLEAPRPAALAVAPGAPSALSLVQLAVPALPLVQPAPPPADPAEARRLAARLAALADAERAWSARIAAYQFDQERVRATTGDPGPALQVLRARHFTTEEQVLLDARLLAGQARLVQD